MHRNNFLSRRDELIFLNENLKDSCIFEIKCYDII